MNIFTEQKVHAAKDNSHKTLCGTSGNALPKTTTSNHSVTCLKCLKIIHKNK